MQRKRADVGIIYDASYEPKDIAQALNGYFSLNYVKLDGKADQPSPDNRFSIICSNLASVETVNFVRHAGKEYKGEKLFIFPTHNQKAISRLDQFDEEQYLVRPVDPLELRRLAQAGVSRYVERCWEELHPTKRQALKKGLECFEKCFSQVRRGEPLPMEEINSSCQEIRNSAALGGLDGWIGALDDHHNYSFRHSMFVCGTLTYFGSAIGISGTDLEMLSIGGLLHDVGKAEIPLNILDKPGKLDEEEWQIMRTHPDHSRTVLLANNGLDEDTIAMAVSHHEKLDGTGYPDGLSGSQLSDPVRLTAIADVYSALIDKRAYKGSMSPEAALDMMEKFHGHLDMDLLGAFRKFVLDAS